MSTYEVTGTVTLKVRIIMDADCAGDACNELDERLRPVLYLAGYSPDHDTSGTEIVSQDLAIRQLLQAEAPAPRDLMSGEIG
jgi:hypothetical protein